MQPDEVIAELAKVISGLAPVVADPAASLWKFGPIGDSRVSAHIRVEAHWISVEATAPGNRETDAARILRLQSVLPGGIKLVGRHGGTLRAEIPLLVEGAASRDWLRRHMALVCAGLRSALERSNGTARLSESDDFKFDPGVLAERCTAGGWRASVRSDEEVRVEFDTRSAHRVATLTQHGGAIRAAVTFDASAEPEAQTHQALGLFLLRANRSLRWVRAFVTAPADTPETTGFECLLAAPGDDQPLVMALDALATACELYGREAEALAQDATLAKHYLALIEEVPVRPAKRVGRVPTGSAPAAGAVTVAATA
jgi:Putative bacterial sensory transduction regulator